MIFIEAPETLSPKIPAAVVEKAAMAALKHESAPADAALTIVLSDDAKLHEMNRQWMGVDAPTDVLSFPAEETDPETGLPYLGDILISVPYAARQAALAGHPVEAEVQLLVAHGVLHLMGHDHAEAQEKSKMWSAQSAILKILGLEHVTVRDE